jgi:flagellar basal-body rod protein FlgB
MGLIQQMLFSDPTKGLMKRDLQLIAQKHKAVASNIANASTPGYKAVKVEFDAQLQKAVSKNNLKMVGTNAKHMSSGQSVAHVKPNITIDTTSKGRIDGNTVDLDTEMGLLTQNQIMWNSILTMKKQYGSIMKRALEDK